MPKPMVLIGMNMKIAHVVVLSFLIGSFVCAPSGWASEPEQTPEVKAVEKANFFADQRALFTKADTNFDSKVSGEEAAELHFTLRKPKHEKRFKALDINSNGYMSEDEMMVSNEVPQDVQDDRFQRSTDRLMKRFDHDENGYISEAEIYSYYETLAASKKETSAKRTMSRFKKLDADASGAVSLEEYIASISPSALAKAKAARVSRGMNRRDVNNDGFVTHAENEDFLETLFPHLDKDGNGTLSAKEQSVYPYQIAQSNPFR